MNETTDSMPRNRELAAEGAMTIAEAMAFLRVGRTEVYRHIGTGDLITAKLGKRRLVLRRSAVELLAKLVVSAD